MSNFALSTTEPTAGFNYSALPDNVAIEARAAAAAIRSGQKRINADVIEIGLSLLRVREALDHGLFGDWLAAEFGADPRTAQNYMNVARQFGDKPEIISDLPMTVAYKLAAPSVPGTVRAMVTQYLTTDREPTTTVVVKMLNDGVEAERRRKAMERETARRAKLSEDKRKTEDQRAKARQRREAAEQRENDRIERKRRPHATLASASVGLNCHGRRSSMALLGWPWTIRVMTAAM